MNRYQLEYENGIIIIERSRRCFIDFHPRISEGLRSIARISSL